MLHAAPLLFNSHVQRFRPRAANLNLKSAAEATALYLQHLLEQDLYRLIRFFALGQCTAPCGAFMAKQQNAGEKSNR